ncbi:hypothetical protein SELMODRAFT_407312 [Selaginella moellendorffii]|uniref:Glycosyltransferase n=1 Tax=Selaginella moellendorffii TaxID=88036 RepID=D8R4L9_SELML|nr:linamarin synthase 1 [Selaginella moellendorffii]EFJ33496.1 hypothetical protein SELMODRAFT_407312 [Selaginella moellendorffii]|eukprot:XP_002966076.1 linamarin synthase 1 [Selaginella moellendorffii]
MGSLVDSRPHAVALPVAVQGHVSPLLHLCKALASRGFVITFINTEAVQSRMKHVTDGEDGLDIRFETVPGTPLDFDLFYKDNRLIFFKSMEDMEGPVEKLLVDKISKRGPPVSCLISDLFYRWSRDVAQRVGILNVTFWTSTAHSLLLEYHLPKLLEHGDIPVQDFSIDKVITYIPGVSPLPIWGLPSVLSAHDEKLDPGFARRHHRTTQMAKDAWVLFNSFEELEGEAFEAAREINANSIAVGPLLLCTGEKKASNPSLWNEDQECLSWLDKQVPESVLYISFGSIATLSLEQFMEISAGLEELQRPFLWAIRPKSIANLEAEFFESFKARVGGFGLVVSWAPQLEILQHPSTGGFLSHCGWNSTLESISGGVPMICWPCIAEQNLNCKLVVEDWKIGLKFSNVATQKLVTREEFVKVVKTLMEEESGSDMRNNVKKIKEEAYKTVLKGGSSYGNLQKFVESMRSI